MELRVLLEKMLIFLVLMAIGWGLARKGTLSKTFTKAASALTINVFLCATIIGSGLSMETELGIGELGKLLLIAFLMQGLGYIVSALVARLLRPERQREVEFELLMSMGNSMFIALPIVGEVYGPTAVFYSALTCIPFNVLLYTYGVLRLKSGSGDKKLHWRDILSMPLLATTVSLLIMLLHLPVPGAIRGLITAMAGATMPLSMVVIGATMGAVSFLDAFRNKSLYLASFVRLILIPLLTWLLLRPLGLDPVLLMTMVVIAACPGAVVVTVLCVQYGRDAVYTSEGTLQSTVLSMVTIPLLMLLLG